MDVQQRRDTLLPKAEDNWFSLQERRKLDPASHHTELTHVEILDVRAEALAVSEEEKAHICNLRLGR